MVDASVTRSEFGSVASNGLQPLAIGFVGRSSVLITRQSPTGSARRVPRGRELARQRSASEWRC